MAFVDVTSCHPDRQHVWNVNYGVMTAVYVVSIQEQVYGQLAVSITYVGQNVCYSVSVNPHMGVIYDFKCTLYSLNII